MTAPPNSGPLIMFTQKQETLLTLLPILCLNPSCNMQLVPWEPFISYKHLTITFSSILVGALGELLKCSLNASFSLTPFQGTLIVYHHDIMICKTINHSEISKIYHSIRRLVRMSISDRNRWPINLLHTKLFQT